MVWSFCQPGGIAEHWKPLRNKCLTYSSADAYFHLTVQPLESMLRYVHPGASLAG